MALEPNDEKKQRRAETARANGRKSRGPKTALGKLISSLNAITTGKSVDIDSPTLPRFLSLLTLDDREAYVELFQNHIRQFRPESACELNLVRHITIELFEYERLINTTRFQYQEHLNGVLRELPATDDEFRRVEALRRNVHRDTKFLVFLQRTAAGHLRAYHSFLRALRELRRDFKMLPAERPDITPDTNVAATPEPPATIVAEIKDQLERVANEPNFQPFGYIADLLDDEDFISGIVPNLDLAMLRRRLGRPEPPPAA